MLTAFGKLVRKHRIDKEKKMYDMAKALNVTSSFMSAVETGKKPIPKEGSFVDRVAQFLTLSPAETEELRNAALQSRKIIQFEVPEDAKRRELAAAFARRLPDMTEEMVDMLREELLDK